MLTRKLGHGLFIAEQGPYVGIAKTRAEAVNELFKALFKAKFFTSTTVPAMV